MNDKISIFSIVLIAIISALFYMDRKKVKTSIKVTDDFIVGASIFKKLIYLCFELVFVIYLIASFKSKDTELALKILIVLMLVYNSYLFYRNRLSLSVKDHRFYIKDPFKNEIVLAKDQLAYKYDQDQKLIYIYKARENKPLFIANENHMNYSNLKNYLFKNQIKKKI